jgi:hypothetical protein
MFPDKIIKNPKKLKKEKYWKYIQKLFFVLPHWRIIFCYFCILQKFSICIFCKEGSALIKEKKVQVYCIGDKKNKDL